MNCFFGHKWKITDTGSAMLYVGPSILVGRAWDEPVQIQIETCSKCGKKRAFYERLNLSRRKISVWAAEKYVLLPPVND